MKLLALSLLVILAKTSAYLKTELGLSCLERGFDLTFSSTPDTCYLKSKTEAPMAWSASWTKCSSLGSGDGLKAHTLQPRSAEVQEGLLDLQRAAHIWTNIGLTFGRNEDSCVLHGADYFGRPPAWLSLTQLSFPGIRQQLGVFGTAHCLTYVGKGEGVAGAFVGRHTTGTTDSYYINLVHTKPVQNSLVLLCQLRAFSAGSGVLARQAARAATVLDDYRLRAFPAPSLAACSLACLRTGLCFGLGFGGGRCELFRLAPAEMVGPDTGWDPTPEGLYFYAFDWPVRR